jgi:hypothetical protein
MGKKHGEKRGKKYQKVPKSTKNCQKNQELPGSNKNYKNS